MRKQKKSMLVLAIITTFIAAGSLLPKLIDAGELEPPGPPITGTMKTLDQIPPTWSQILLANDGVDSCSSSRFECLMGVMGDDAVLDKETGLVWAKNANLTPSGKDWKHAIIHCRNLALGGRKGWRLPTVEELASLVDPSQSNPALPSGHPFYNVQSYYWSSTTYEWDSGYAWFVDMSSGITNETQKTWASYYVWPVRGGN